MNKDSIIFSSTLNYIITTFLLIFSSIFLLTSERIKKDEEIFDRYKTLIKIVHKQKGYFNFEFTTLLKEMNYEIIPKEEVKNILEKEDKKLVFARNRGKDFFKIFEIENKNYIQIEQGNDVFLIKDNESLKFSNSFYIIIVFILLFIVVTILYIKTLKKLNPLKDLQKNMKFLANENFDFKLSNSNKKDEITLLANEFKNTALKLKNIKESRNIFIRNIMHELKTPITKGKFLLQLENSEENIEKLKMVFNRLESLIKEFATIEELISQNKELEKKSYFLEDLLDEAKDILMIDDELVVNSYENIKLFVNFKLFSIAIKNLIDNAIKYSTDKKVEIKTINDDILFINSGKKLEGNFEKYLEPFVKKGDSNSFGLGLYIVNTILKSNSYRLVYKYEDNQNVFICKKIDKD